MLFAHKKFWTHYICTRKINSIFIVVTFCNINNFWASEEFAWRLNMKRICYKAEIFSFELLYVHSWVLLIAGFKLALDFLLLIIELLQSMINIFIIFIFIHLVCFIILFIIFLFLLIFKFLLLSSVVGLNFLLSLVFCNQIVVVIIEVRLTLVIIFILALLIIIIILYYSFFLNN